LYPFNTTEKVGVTPAFFYAQNAPAVSQPQHDMKLFARLFACCNAAASFPPGGWVQTSLQEANRRAVGLM